MGQDREAVAPLEALAAVLTHVNQGMLTAIDRLPSADTFDDFLSCNVPRAPRAVRTIRERHLTMFSPASDLVRDVLTGLGVGNFNPMEVQALLELRDRLEIRAHTSARLLARQ